MSGGYHNRSGVDSPGKHNTRTKYASIVQLSAPVVPIVSHGPIVSYDPVLNHFPLSGGYYNLPLESPGKYSSRVKYSSIHSNRFLAAVPVVSHIPAFHRSSIKGGFQNRPSDSPGKHSTRVKYSTIRPASVPVAAPVAPIVAYAHPIKGGYYNAPLESPGKYSSRIKYTSQLRGISPASVASSAAAPSPSKASASQAQIDAVKKQYGGAYTCIVQVVNARTSDPEQNYFQDEFDGEGLNIDEAAVRKMLQSLPAPLNLQSIENKGKSELKFVVQNTATKLSSDFIITYKGGDIDICSAD